VSNNKSQIYNLIQLQLELTATVGGGTGELVGPGVGASVGCGR